MENYKIGIGLAVGFYYLLKIPRAYRYIRRYGLRDIKQFLARIILRLPSNKKKLKETDAQLKETFTESVKKGLVDPVYKLPDQGMNKAEILRLIQQQSQSEKQHWETGKISGAIYTSTQDIIEVGGEALKLWSISNPLHADIFPRIRQKEAELIRMTIDLYHGPQGSCGTCTSGGTESIMLAMLAYREWGRARGIEYPEVIGPDTIHVAFNKAAFYFGINLIQVPTDPITKKADIKNIRREINSNTVALVGSSPCFPYGVVDPIAEMGQLALQYGINLHQDACLGGYILPFAQEAGFELNLPDFRVQGVTSISCDIHKYGYSPKGISILMWINEELRRYQYYFYSEWTGGLYGTQTLAGSRPGCIPAAAWATIMMIGKQGYIQITRELLQACEILKNTVIDGLEVIGTPNLTVYAYTSKEFNAHAVAEIMNSKGWNLNILQNPVAFHMCVTQANYTQLNHFINDLKHSVSIIRENPEAWNKGTVALYGAASVIPDKGIVSQLCYNFLDSYSYLQAQIIKLQLLVLP